MAKPSGMPISLEGLCPHHEQAFAAQLMAQQLQNMTGGNLLYNIVIIDCLCHVENVIVKIACVM